MVHKIIMFCYRLWEFNSEGNLNMRTHKSTYSSEIFWTEQSVKKCEIGPTFEKNLD